MDALLQALNALLGREPDLPPHIDWRLRVQARLDAEAQAAARRQEPAPEAQQACGWFDSSHDLARGLRIEELASSEALAALPLGLWLELQQVDCRPTAPDGAADFER